MPVRIGLWVLVAVAAACSKSDPNFCPGNPNDNCLDDGPRACRSDPDCSGAEPACDRDMEICVECTRENRSACSDDKPACGDDNACRGCIAHDECADSGACLPSGACAAAGDVAYVEAGRAGAPPCAQDAACGSLAQGLLAGKPYIKVSGDLVEAAEIAIGGGAAATILAAPGAKLRRTANGAILRVSGMGTRIAIYDLEITGQTGDADHAIELEAGGGAPQLSLVRVRITRNVSGVHASAGALEIARSEFSFNSGGGLTIAGPVTFDITNTFFVRNGNAVLSRAGGVSIAFGAAGSRFEFNTVVDNGVIDGTGRSGGVFCDIETFTAPNNIIARNQAGPSTTAPNAQISGLCTFPTSRVQSDIADLRFASPDVPPLSYRLTDGSAAIDGATTPSNLEIDHDGDRRPQGAAKDIGADELRR